MSSHTAELPLPMLPRKARVVHLFPALKGTSLISVSQLCDAGCVATFTNSAVVVTYENHTIVKGDRCPDTHLWKVSLENDTSTKAPAVSEAFLHQHTACNVTLPTTAASMVQFHLTCLFLPVLTTVAHALKNSLLPNVPGLTLKSLQKYGKTTMATQKGHLDQNRASQNSTTVPSSMETETIEHLFPEIIPDTEKTHHCFAAISTFSKKGNENASFSDQTGKFPF